MLICEGQIKGHNVGGILGEKANLVRHITKMARDKFLEIICTYDSISIHPPKNKNIFLVIYFFLIAKF